MIQDNCKTVLILTAKFGAGHISAANSLKDDLLEKDPSLNVIIKDFMNSNTSAKDKYLVNFYEFNTKFTPIIYNLYYYLKKSVNSKYDFTKKIYLPKLSNLILSLKPNIIISTFPLAAACVDSFKRKYSKYDIPCATVVTDVVDSLEWIHPNTNMYFVPSYEIKNRFIQRGIEPNKIKATGVPVSSMFDCENKVSYTNIYRLLFVGGGRGLFDISEDFMYWMDSFIEQIDTKIEITIVTGKNENLYTKLTKSRALKNIKVLGFVTDMHNLIKNTDLIFTKPGGATLFESIRSNTPIIVKSPKVGQEIENARFIVDKGIGIVYSSENDLTDIITNISNNKFNDMIFSMQKNIISFKKTLETKNIPNHLIELMSNKT